MRGCVILGLTFQYMYQELNKPVNPIRGNVTALCLAGAFEMEGTFLYLKMLNDHATARRASFKCV